LLFAEVSANAKEGEMLFAEYSANIKRGKMPFAGHPAKEVSNNFLFPERRNGGF
jgi:hypothetical protein